MENLARIDPEVAEAIRNETRREGSQLEMIASENFVSEAVLEALGTVLTNKYAEGLPGKRYYGGCEIVDLAEDLARDRACRLFGADHANVQPHAGAQANLASYLAFLKPGDRFLGMDLSHGGHLTHGSPVNASGILYEAHAYGVRESDGRIDYDAVREKARTVRPKMIIAGASAYPRVIDFQAFGEIAREVDAVLLVDMAHIAGLVAAEVIPSPVPYADFVTFTTYKTLRGGRGGVILCKQDHADRINRAIFPGGQGTPSLNFIAAKAVCFHLAMSDGFVELQNKTLKNAACFAGEFERLGYRIVSGGTDNHLILIDLRPKGLTGALAEKTLESVGIIVNRNVIPGDPERPDVTSGMRIGSPAISSRGMAESEVRQIVRIMDAAMSNSENSQILGRVANEVQDLCEKFPVQK